MMPTGERSDEDLERQYELTPDPLLAALEHLDLGILIIDADLLITAMNGRARHILGIPDDLVQNGTTLEDIFRFNAENGRYGPGDVEEHVRRRAENAKLFEAHESERTQADGTTIHIKRTPLPDGRLLSVYSDVTAAKNSERDAGLAKAILDQLPSPVFCKDDQRRYEFCNAAHLEIYGLTWEGAIGTTGAQTIAADEVEAYKRSDEHLLSTGEKFRAEHQIKRADGAVLEVVTNKTRIKTPDGRMHIVGSIADVTDLKRHQDSLRETREHAESDRQRLLDAIAVLEEGFAATARGAALGGTEAANKAVSAMGNIEKSSRQISDIIGLIQEIAFQTNLLSLNAAVEAARAGDAGRGFAVVASEVRALAQRAAAASKDIAGLITTSDHQVTEGVKLVNDAGRALEEIAETVKKAADQVSEISATSEQQATYRQRISRDHL